MRPLGSFGTVPRPACRFTRSRRISFPHYGCNSPEPSKAIGNTCSVKSVATGSRSQLLTVAGKTNAFAVRRAVPGFGARRIRVRRIRRDDGLIIQRRLITGARWATSGDPRRSDLRARKGEAEIGTAQI